VVRLLLGPPTGKGATPSGIRRGATIPDPSPPCEERKPGICARVLTHEANPRGPELPPWIAVRPQPRLVRGLFQQPRTPQGQRQTSNDPPSTPEARPWKRSLEKVGPTPPAAPRSGLSLLESECPAEALNGQSAERHSKKRGVPPINSPLQAAC